jgi:hypothetical protein
MAEWFHHDVGQDFVAEYAAGRTSNPCVRCNEKIKFAAVLTPADSAVLTPAWTAPAPRSAPTRVTVGQRLGLRLVLQP